MVSSNKCEAPQDELQQLKHTDCVIAPIHVWGLSMVVLDGCLLGEWREKWKYDTAYAALKINALTFCQTNMKSYTTEGTMY